MGFYYQKTLEGWLILFVSKIFPLRILRNSVCGSTLIQMVICNVCMWFLRFKLINLKSRVRLDLLVTHMRRNTDWMHSPVRLKKKQLSFPPHLGDSPIHTRAIPRSLAEDPLAPCGLSARVKVFPLPTSWHSPHPLSPLLYLGGLSLKSGTSPVLTHIPTDPKSGIILNPENWLSLYSSSAW